MFVAAKGKFSPSLEDVSTLNMLLLVSDTHVIGVVLDTKGQEKLNFLNKALYELSSSWNKATYVTWLH